MTRHLYAKCYWFPATALRLCPLLPMTSDTRLPELIVRLPLKATPSN